jgi:hypothetical protein
MTTFKVYYKEEPMLSELPKAAVSGIMAVLKSWQLLILVPVAGIVWVVISKHVDANYQPKGPLKEIEMFISSQLDDIYRIADRCGGQIFDPRRFFDCVGSKGN